MPTYLCPKGHQSSEPDYCSECGAKMQATSPEPAAPTAAGAETCPDCGTQRSPDIAFCEICGYNFVTGAHGDISAIPLPPPIMFPPTPEPPAPPAAAAEWTATLSVDPALQDPASPPPPEDLVPVVFPLSAAASLIGRRSEPRAIFPDIPVQHDDAVSHRHALLQLSPEGTLSVRDIGSSNGTRLNGTDLKSMTDYPLKDGDVLAFGHWSVLAVSHGTSTPATA